MYLYDLEKQEASEATMTGDDTIANPHDVSATNDGLEVVVAELNPPSIWVFSKDGGKVHHSTDSNSNSAQPVMSEISEGQIRSKGFERLDVGPVSYWQVAGVMVVFIVGFSVILRYLRKL
jgi:hypothetical protein